MSKRNVKRNGRLEDDPTAMPGDERQLEEPLDEAAVAELAYRRWVEKRCPQGSAEDDWFEAERDLRSARATVRSGR
jgi:hypothetical protein